MMLGENENLFQGEVDLAEQAERPPAEWFVGFATPSGIVKRVGFSDLFYIKFNLKQFEDVLDNGGRVHRSEDEERTAEERIKQITGFALEQLLGAKEEFKKRCIGKNKAYVPFKVEIY